jgi:hypothetical protein
MITRQTMAWVGLGVWALLLSRVIFVFLDDPEGPNLVVVVGTAIVLYLTTASVYLWSQARTITLRRLLAVSSMSDFSPLRFIGMQMVMAVVVYLGMMYIHI